MTSRSSPKSRSRILTRILANVGAALSALWLLTYILPASREMRLDAAFAFLLELLLIVLLWWAVYRSLQPRRFWGLLAAAWTVGLLATLAWGLYEPLTGEGLPTISLVDAVYLLRYFLVFMAFWRCMGVPAGRQWLSLAAVLLAAAAVMAGLYLVSPADSRGAIDPYLAGAVYPILDVCLIYLVVDARGRQPRSRLRKALGLLALALLAYGAANWLNSYGQLISFEAVIELAALFWPLSDILVGLAVLHLLWVVPSSTPLREDPRE